MSSRFADIWAVVPIKRFSQAKQRLAPRYAPAFREGLARAMAEDVVAALAGVQELSGVLVVTEDSAAAEIASRHGALVAEAGATAGHTGAVAAAAQRLAQEGRGGMLTTPCDVPLATSDEFAHLVRTHLVAPAFSIVPAHDRRGSNAIICSPPDGVPLRFGDDSFFSHLVAARQRGIQPRVVPLPGIGLDIDNPQDLAIFMRQPPTNTRAWSFLASRKLVRRLTADEDRAASKKA